MMPKKSNLVTLMMAENAKNNGFLLFELEKNKKVFQGFFLFQRKIFLLHHFCTKSMCFIHSFELKIQIFANQKTKHRKKYRFEEANIEIKNDDDIIGSSSSRVLLFSHWLLFFFIYL